MNSTGSIWPKRSSTPSLAEIGRAGRPDRAERGGGQHGRRWSPACWASSPRRGRPSSRRARRNTCCRRETSARSSSQDSRRSTLSSPRKTIASPAPDRSEQVFGEIQRRVGKEGRARHPVAVDAGVRSPRSPMTPQKSQTRSQNAAAVVDRPAMQVGIGRANGRPARCGGACVKAVSGAASIAACGDGDQSVPARSSIFLRERRAYAYRMAREARYCPKIAWHVAKAPLRGSHWLEMIA